MMGLVMTYWVLSMIVAGLTSVSAACSAADLLSWMEAAGWFAEGWSFRRQSLRLTKSVARCEALPPCLE